MWAGLAGFSNLFAFPIPAFAMPAVWIKAGGVTTFGFGLGAVCHYITKNGPGDMDMIAIWRN